MRKLAMLLAALTALVCSPNSASAQEGRGQPFITAAYYQDNISLDQFQANPRSFFRSEAAFDLIANYVGDEVGRTLTAGEFIALMHDETQTRVRDCQLGERINTGAYDAGQFHWFTRLCRPGEQIVQVKLGDRWIDLFSLNCLNAVEDQTPVEPPQLTIVTVSPPAPPQRGMVVVTTTVAPRAEESSLMGAFPYGWPVAPNYQGGNINVGSWSYATSSSTSGCTSGCAPVPHHRP